MKSYKIGYKIRFIPLFLIFFLSTTCSFAYDNKEVVGRVKEAAIFIIAEFQSKPPNTGTGFVIDTIKSPGLLIVTNKHILQYKEKDKVINSNNIRVKINLSGLEPTIYSAEIVALHDYYDLALLRPLRLEKIPKDITEEKSNEKKYFKWKTRNILLEDSIINDGDIKEGLDVFYSGFPLQLGSREIQNYPIARRGMIAQVIPSEQTIIIDGFVSSGNSGSAVYCIVDNGIKLLGIMVGYMPDKFISYDEHGNISSLVSFNSGLSVVIKAPVVRNFIYKLIDEGKYKGEWSN